MTDKANARRVRPGAGVPSGRRNTADCSRKAADRQDVANDPSIWGVGDRIAAIDLADRLFGRIESRALWRRLGMPSFDDLPRIEAAFLDRQTEPRAGAKIAAAQLRAAYIQWCDDRGIEPLSPGAFGSALKRLGVAKIKSNATVYLGLRLRRAGGQHEHP